jgi:hypothetical protein
MSPIRSTAILPALGLVALLPACEAAGLASRETFATCAAEVGIGSDYTVDPVRVADGYGGTAMTLMIVPDANTTQAQADAANACVVRRLSEATGRPMQYAPLLGSQLTAPAQAYAPMASQTVAPAPAVAPSGAAPLQCNRLEMRGGSGYACIQ